VAAADAKAELVLTAAADAPPGKFGNIIIAAQSKFGGQDIAWQTPASELELLAP
jgi:hypothetical protein